MRDHYKVLGVPHDASFRKIKTAYQRLATEFHPDRNPGSQIAEEMLKMINEAYDVLSDPEQRIDYDRVRPVDEAPPLVRPAAAPPAALLRLLISLLGGRNNILVTGWVAALSAVWLGLLHMSLRAPHRHLNTDIHFFPIPAALGALCLYRAINGLRTGLITMSGGATVSTANDPLSFRLAFASYLIIGLGLLGTALLSYAHAIAF
jgi:hypothetical protein